MTERTKRGSVFISYRREDAGQHVLHLIRALQPPLSDEQLFYDRESLRAGDRWKERLREEIAKCSVFLALIGKKWLQARNEASGRRRLDERGDWVRTEIELALERTAASGLVVVPLLLDGASMPEAAHLPESIAALCDHQAHRLRTATRSDWEHDVREVLEIISDQGGLALAVAPLVIDIDDPEVGAIHFANEATQSFTITNTSKATYKVGITLDVSAVEDSNRVRLRKAGAILTEYQLHATLDTPGAIDLLASANLKVILAPGESEAFRLALAGNEGFEYTCSLVATCKNLETGSKLRAVSPEFAVVFPIRSVELLRTRKSRESGE